MAETPGSEISFSPPSKEDLLFIHPDYPGQADKWTYIDDCYGGEKMIKKKIDTYLPQDNGETDKSYKKRCQMSRFFNATRRAINGLAGFIFRKEPSTNIDESTAPELDKIIKNVDRNGAHLYEQAKFAANLLFRRGHFLIMTDMPPYKEDQTIAQAEEVGARPYLTVLDPIEIKNWQVEVDSKGVEKLTLLVRHQKIWKRAGAFQVKEILRITVFTPGQWMIFEDLGQDGFLMVNRGQFFANGAKIDYIPVQVVYGEKSGSMVSEPFFYDFALENVRHYQIDTDLRWSNHLLAVPLPIFSGVNPDEIGDEISFGPGMGMKFRNPEMRYGYLETSGVAPEVLGKELDRSERKLALYALRIFDTREDYAIKTLGEEKMKAAAEHSILATYSISLSKGFSSALNEAYSWQRGEKNDFTPELKFNTDFTSMRIDIDMIRILKELTAEQLLPLESFWDALREGEIFLPMSNEEMKLKLAENGLGMLAMTAAGRSPESRSGPMMGGMQTKERMMEDEDMEDKE